MDKTGRIEFQGKKIFYRLACPEGNKKYPGILFLHGANSSLATFDLIIDDLKRDFVCLAFDRLGNDKSEGKFEDFTLEDQLRQAKFMLKYLLGQEKINQQKIIVVGGSMGAHIASRLTTQGEITHLILRAPASYSKEYEKVKMVESWLPWDRKNKKWAWEPSFAFEAISQFKGALLIVRSEKDEIIPDRIISRYLDSAKSVRAKEVKTIVGAPHSLKSFPVYQQEFLRYIKEFIT